MSEAAPVIPEYINLDKGISYAEYQRHINSYVFASKFVQNKVVLDVACGSGTGSTYLASRSAKAVFGGDISKDALRDAKRWNKDWWRVAFILLDAEVLPFADNSFDVVVSFETIEHLKQLDRFLSECRRILKEGGFFICATPNKKVHSPLFRKPVNPYHLREFRSGELYQLLGKYFGSIELYGLRQLGLWNKMRMQAIHMAAQILLTLFSREKTENFLYRLYPVISRESHIFKFEENIEETLDRNWQVIPIKDNLFTTPKTIVAVAK
jgi:ubiquinone/menaquinone biosynthesis C-methylase UbiE